jgi:peptidyl-prolyl cis-trans isomerase B (cyclophilin B)
LVSSKKQQRKAVARAKYEAYLERKAVQHRRHRRNQMIVGGVVTVAIVGAAVVWSAGVFDGDDAPSAGPSTSPTPTSSNEPMSFKRAQQVLTKGHPATATLATDNGDITIELATKDAPQNSNSLAFLAEQGYFDGTACHRLTAGDPLYVLQCGDTIGDGTSDPGYTTSDENLPKAGDDNYPVGTVAMAEPQNGEAGGQFFLVYKDSTLPPNFTIVGQITKGLDVVKGVAAAGVAGGGNDGPPAKPITIESVTIDEA